MVSVERVRVATAAVCVAGIAGMIVSSIGDHSGAAITFGLATAVAVVCSMVAKAVAADTARRVGGTEVAATPSGQFFPTPAAESLAELVERQVQAALTEGASEATVRQLVGEAVRLGRILGAGGSGR